jgi:hypothetical protein
MKRYQVHTNRRTVYVYARNRLEALRKVTRLSPEEWGVIAKRADGIEVTYVDGRAAPEA